MAKEPEKTKLNYFKKGILTKTKLISKAYRKRERERGGEHIFSIETEREESVITFRN